MPDPLLQSSATAVVVAQIAVPLLLAWPAWRVEPPVDRAPAGNGRRRRRRGRRDGPEVAPPPGPPRAALCCSGCQAPVPLLSASFPCPFCATPTTPPAAYADGLAAAARAERELARAERVWRWSRVWTSLPVVWTGRLATVVWLVVVVGAAAVLSPTWPKAVLGLATIVAVAQTFFGLALWGAFRELRREVPPLPARADMTAPAETGQCLGCRSPLAFAVDRFSSVCGYCTAVQYRRALADAAHSDAKDAEAAARHSVLDGLHALEEKRFELAGAVALTGIGVVFYSVVFALSVVADTLGF